MKIIVPFVLIGLLAWPQTIVAADSNEQSASIVSLSAVIEETLGNNPDLAAMRHRWEAAREEIPQARALDDPHVTLTQWAIPSNFNLFGAEETWIGLEQAIPFPGKRSLRGRMAETAADVGEQNYRAKVRETVAAVKAAYARLFLARKMIDLHVEHQALLEEFIEVARRKYTVGQLSQQALLKAQVELSRLHNSLLIAEQEVVSALTEMNRLLGRPPEGGIGPLDALTERPFSHTINALQERALANRPELRAASFAIQQSEQAKALAKKNYLPDFAVEVAYWNVHSGSDRWQAALTMNLPWLFPGKYDARVRQAAMEEQRARAEFVATRNDTIARLHDLFAGVKSAERLLQTYQGGVLPQAEQLLESARIGYQAGRVDFLEVIESERTLRDMQLDYYTALAQFWQQAAEIERVVGEDVAF